MREQRFCLHTDRQDEIHKILEEPSQQNFGNAGRSWNWAISRTRRWNGSKRINSYSVVTMDVTKNDCSRPLTMRFPDSISSRSALTNLGGELFARIFLTGSLTSVCFVRAIFQIAKTSTKMKLVFARGWTFLSSALLLDWPKVVWFKNWNHLLSKYLLRTFKRIICGWHIFCKFDSRLKIPMIRSVKWQWLLEELFRRLNWRSLKL